MAYTSAQLASMYSNVHIGLAPNATQSAILDEIAQASRNGQISDAQAQYYVVNTADADTAVALQSYQFFTGKTPTQGGLSYLVNSASNTTDLNDAYYQGFSLENRYINFAQNLGIIGEGKASFTTTYSALTFAQTVQAAYEQIVGSTYATAAGINPAAAIADITSRQGYFQQVAAERMAGQNQDLAVKAAVVGYIMAEAIKADVGIYAAGVNNFLADLAPDNIAQYNNDLTTNYGAQTGGISPAGHVIALTGSFDSPGGSAPAVNTQGGSGADVYVADNASLTNDSINGGAGADRLLLTNTGTAAYTATPSLVSVEQVELSSTKGGALTLDLTNAVGVTSVVAQGGATGFGPNDIGVSTVSVLNGTTGMTVTADVDDSAAGSVSFGLKTDGLADTLTVTLRNTDTGVTATKQGLTSLTTNGVETLTITSSKAAIPAATVDANDTLSVATLTDTAATKLVLSGDSAISLGSTGSSLGALASVDASAMTKAVTLGSTTVAFSTAVAGADILTGSGDDLVSLNVGSTQALKSVNLGTGSNDTLVLSGGFAGGTTVVDLSAADQVSSVTGTANAALQFGIENIDLRGMVGNAQITGSAGVNSIVGTAGADTITGGAGADIIDVGSGVDTLVQSAAGQTGGGISANGVVTGGDIVTGMGAGDRVSLTALAVGVLNGASATEGSAYLSGGSGNVALVDGTYNASTGQFTAGAGPDILFQYDTNGAVAGGVEGIVLVGSNASISSVSSDGFGMFTFA